ncbi:MAG: excinuclease ABC subunit UvrC [Propionibacteriaceae bacterium]|jgi:excinuclease ABC subunit C|nr:excinuclease ABC subunit UvrC [Propionibacteriaceae bacterium]
MPDPALWRPKTSEIPAEPGVYRFMDEQGRVIYVGKAISLRSRLTSYFQAPIHLHPRTRVMTRTAARVEWTVVRNELEALQLEYTWIKQFEPRFNIKYRDDKTYPWLCVTWSDEYPRVFVGRGAKRKGWRYFGPYAEAWAIRDSIDTLLTVFPMRTCSNGVFRSAQASGRPCLMGYIDKCCAPCVGRVDAQEHRAIAADFSTAIAGRTGGFIRHLEKRMRQAAEAMEYERAGALRDKIEALRRVADRNAVVLEDSADVDVIALAVDPLEVAVELFTVRSGRILSERGWVADRQAAGEGSAPDEANQPSSMSGGDDPVADDQTGGVLDVDPDENGLSRLIEAALLQIYGDVEGDAEERKRVIPPEVLLPQLPDSTPTLTQLLSQERGAKVRLRVPRRGDKRTLMATVQRNAEQTLTLHKTRRASDLTTRNQALDEIAQALGMDEAPLRIECYDISHIQGTNVVASMVVFEDGLPRKSEYRHFAIQSVESNDVGAMREVMTRRFARLVADQEAMAAKDPSSGLIDATTREARRFSYPPALVVVDGARPQAEVTREVLDAMGFDSVMVCGLAKRLEEVWLPDEEYPVILPRSSQALYLLQRVRDEAHRFAITYHRQRRSRSMIESLLDGVQGLGEVRRKALTRAFPSLKKLRAASAEQIGQVPGFGPTLAQAVVEAVAAKPDAINLATGEVMES